MWANHHALFRIVARVDQLLLLANLLLLGFVAFLPLPTRLVAQHTSGGDARAAMLLYGATLTGCALAFNLIWRHTVHRGLLADGGDPRFRRDVDSGYLAGLTGYLAAPLLAFVQPWLTLAVTALLALLSSSAHPREPPPQLTRMRRKRTSSRHICWRVSERPGDESSRPRKRIPKCERCR